MGRLPHFIFFRWRYLNVMLGDLSKLYAFWALCYNGFF